MMSPEYVNTPASRRPNRVALKKNPFRAVESGLGRYMATMAPSAASSSHGAVGETLSAPPMYLAAAVPKGTAIYATARGTAVNLPRSGDVPVMLLIWCVKYLFGALR